MDEIRDQRGIIVGDSARCSQTLSFPSSGNSVPSFSWMTTTGHWISFPRLSCSYAWPQHSVPTSKRWMEALHASRRHDLWERSALCFPFPFLLTTTWMAMWMATWMAWQELQWLSWPMQWSAMWRVSEPKDTKSLCLLHYRDPMSALGHYAPLCCPWGRNELLLFKSVTLTFGRIGGLISWDSCLPLWKLSGMYWREEIPNTALKKKVDKQLKRLVGDKNLERSLCEMFDLSLNSCFSLKKWD